MRRVNGQVQSPKVIPFTVVSREAERTTRAGRRKRMKATAIQAIEQTNTSEWEQAWQLEADIENLLAMGNLRDLSEETMARIEEKERALKAAEAVCNAVRSRITALKEAAAEELRERRNPGRLAI